MIINSKFSVSLLKYQKLQLLKWQFILLSMLNLIDGLLTYWGLYTGTISEANPFMRWVWNVSPETFIGLKIFLSCILIVLANCTYRFQFQVFLCYVLTGINVIYSGVLLLHLYWVTTSTFY